MNKRALLATIDENAVIVQPTFVRCVRCGCNVTRYQISNFMVVILLRVMGKSLNISSSY